MSAGLGTALAWKLLLETGVFTGALTGIDPSRNRGERPLVVGPGGEVARPRSQVLTCVDTQSSGASASVARWAGFAILRSACFFLTNRATSAAVSPGSPNGTS